MPKRSGPQKWRFLPRVTFRQALQFIFLGGPLAFILNAFSSGKVALGLVAVAATAGAWTLGFLAQLWLNRISYYPWYVLRRMPTFVLAFGLLSLTAYQTYQFAETEQVFGWGSVHLTRGGQVLVLASAFLVSAFLLRRGLSKLAPLSFQSHLPDHIASAALAFTGSVEPAIVGRTEMAAGTDSNYSFEVRIATSDFVHSLGVSFIAIERLDEGRTSGIVWTSTMTRPLQPAAVTTVSATPVLINFDGAIRRCHVHDGTVLRLVVAASDPTWFNNGSVFRVAIYLTDGGLLTATTTISGTAA